MNNINIEKDYLKANRIKLKIAKILAVLMIISSVIYLFISTSEMTNTSKPIPEPEAAPLVRSDRAFDETVYDPNNKLNSSIKSYVKDINEEMFLYGTQVYIAFLSEKDLGNKNIEEYSVDYFNNNNLGRSDILFTVAEPNYYWLEMGKDIYGYASERYIYSDKFVNEIDSLFFNERYDDLVALVMKRSSEFYRDIYGNNYSYSETSSMYVSIFNIIFVLAIFIIIISFLTYKFGRRHYTRHVFYSPYRRRFWHMPRYHRPTHHTYYHYNSRHTNNTHRPGSGGFGRGGSSSNNRAGGGFGRTGGSSNRSGSSGGFGRSGGGSSSGRSGGGGGRSGGGFGRK